MSHLSLYFCSYKCLLKSGEGVWGLECLNELWLSSLSGLLRWLSVSSSSHFKLSLILLLLLYLIVYPCDCYQSFLPPQPALFTPTTNHHLPPSITETSIKWRQTIHVNISNVNGDIHIHVHEGVVIMEWGIIIFILWWASLSAFFLLLILLQLFEFLGWSHISTGSVLVNNLAMSWEN